MMLSENPAGLDISWEAMECMLKGISAIDMNQMTVQDYKEAELFISNYGYNLQNAKDREELAGIRQEAISFIERRLLAPEVNWEEMGEEPLDLPIPPSLRNDCDTRDLLLVAAKGKGIEQRWACAILKVMHTLCHINNTILYRHFEEAKMQILSRYYQALTHLGNGGILLGHSDESRLSIAGFEVKDEKSRDSMILKLLCKRENVAEEVFDMIGIRIITYTPAEAIITLEVLRRNKVILFPNIIPSRSRNSLIDFDDFQIQYQEILEEYQWGAMGLQKAIQLIREITTDAPQEGFNPKNAATLATYHAIHITQRQLIRFQLPGSDEEIRFFFPYEIQIVDEASYAQNHSGSSAHSLYKKNQLIQARRRVLGPLFITLRRQRRHANPGLEPEPLS